MAADIDFDELDKAVNSLMGGVNEPDDDTPRAKTLEVRDTLKPGEDPKYDKLGEAARGIGNETLEGVREKTVVEDFLPDTDTDAPAPKLPFEEQGQTEEKSSEQEQASDVRPSAALRPTSGSRFMDVVHPALDMKSSTPSSFPTPSRPAVTVARPEELSADSDSQSAKSNDELPLTPFLPDANAKVEKRPLGGTDSEPELQPVGELSLELLSDSHDTYDDPQRPPEPDAPVPELTEEERTLQDIESHPVDESLLDEDAMRHAESGDTGTIHNDEQRDNPDSHKKHHSDQKDNASAIYDVDNYHQALKAAPKKKMGALRITAIVFVVIVLSAAVGAGAVYFLFSMGL